MGASKDMGPSGSQFFPTIFLQNQFRTKPVFPPKDTDLTDKVAVITGANQGLGFETCHQLLSLRLSHLIIAIRRTAKGETAAATLRTKYPQATIEVYQLDMSSYDSIRTFAGQLEKLKRLDIVILNAGVRNHKFSIVPGTGHEEIIQVNYISTVLLCILLLPVLRQKSVTGPGHISIVNSGLALAAKFANRSASPILPSFDQDTKSFDGMEQYNNSKLLGMMFLYKLVDYVSADDVIVNVVDPGFVTGTNLGNQASFVENAFLNVFKAVAARSLKVGASTYVDAVVVKGKESHGCYLMSWKISSFADLLYTADGKEIIEKLWQETMAELSFANVQGILNDMKKA